MAFHNRAAWRARRPVYVNKGNLNQKSTGHWNGPTVRVGGRTTWSHDKCPALVRGIQNFHMDGRGWSDIAYNFVVCPHGDIFEGRGYNVRNGANGTNHGNATSHAIMWLSGQGNPFSEGEKRGFRECAQLVSRQTHAPFSAIGHRDHKSTECPGAERYNWIRQGMKVNGAAAPTPPPNSASPRTIRQGERGDLVRLVQSIAKHKASQDIAIDGVFGPATTNAVKNIQRVFNLRVDGIVGPATWEALKRLNSPATPKGSTPWKAPETIRQGSRGDLVTWVQTVARDKASQDITVDGIFGPATTNAVKNIQRVFKLTPDGIVGPATWAAIKHLTG